MSQYDDRRDDRRRRDRDRGSDRDRDTDHRPRSPVYEEEEIIRARRGPKGSSKGAGALIPRRRDSSESSVEEVTRAFPPGGGSYERRRDNGPKRSRSARDTRRSSRYDDYDDYDDRSRRDRGSKRSKRRDYSSSSGSSRSPPRRDREHRKSLGEQALAALGLGGVAGAALSGRSKSHDRGDRSSGGRRSRRYSDSDSSRSRSRGHGGKKPDAREKMIQAARAAVLAGGAEAWRMRNEPGGWGGAKGKRVLTAAVGAAGIDGLIDKDPDKGGIRHTIESVVGGLAGNRLINGSRKDEEGGSRSRSRSRGRNDSGGGGGGIAGLSAGALAAAATKAFQDRNKSKGGGRRDYSSSSDDGGRGGTRRNKSVSDYMRKGMTALGIGGNSQRDTSDGGARRDLGNESDGGIDPNQEHHRHAHHDEPGAAHHHSDYSQISPSSSSHSSDDSISSSEEERERKQLGHKQLITAGLASVATIHAAHNVYQGMHMRKIRNKEVREGEMSPSVARKKKNKARLQNAAAIGVAALGVKGAYSEWKEMQEQRHEAREFDLKRARRHERRLMKSEQNSSTAHGDHGSTQSAPPDNVYNGVPYIGGSMYSGSTYMDVHNRHNASAPDLSEDPNRYYAEQSGPHYGDVPYYLADTPAVPAQTNHTAPGPPYR